MASTGPFGHAVDVIRSVIGFEPVSLIADWLGLGDFLGEFPTHRPDLPDDLHWTTMVQRVGFPPGVGGDRYCKTGQIATNKTSGQPVARWSYSRQRLLPFLGFDYEGAVIFLDPDKAEPHASNQLALCNTTTPAVEWDNCNATQLAEQKANIAIPGVEIYGQFGPRLSGSTARRTLGKIAAVAAIALPFILPLMGRRR